MQNYVWKAELQRNANIHFHISTDTYIPFQAIRYYWLLSIKPLGYVDAYAAKWSNLTLAEYANKRGISLDDARKPYADGVRSRWQSPNCVDVRSVTTAQSASFYLSKYFAKSDDEKIDPERIAAFGKVWARSQSLSRLAFKNKFSLSEIQDFITLLTQSRAVKVVAYEFATVYYLVYRNLKGSLYSFIQNIAYANGRRYSYPFPIPPPI